jgi:putative ABC transport system permease protein
MSALHQGQARLLPGSGVRRWRHAWRLALRIAWRDARRHPGRSALVVVMIVLPVVAVAASDVVVRSSQLTAAEHADRDMGTTADAIVSAANTTAIEQVPDGEDWRPARSAGSTDSGGSDNGSDPVTRLRAALPAGVTTVAVRDSWSLMQSAADVHAPTASAQVAVTIPADPLAAGKYPTVSGRAATAPDEVELTPSLAHRLGVGVGDRVVTFRPAHTLTVVGIVAQRWSPRGDLALGVLGGDLDPAAATATADNPTARTGSNPYGTSYLVASPTPIRWDDVLRANAAGLLVQSRAVYLDPPPDAAVPFERPGGGSTIPVQAARGLGVAAGMALLEIVLLAGPAFAVGARRQRRELALLAAVGGDRADLRRTVLSQGIVLGLLGGDIGAGAGIGVGLLGRAVLAGHAGIVFGGLHWHPAELVGAAAIGVVTGVLAAMLPARAASRQDVVAALAGRRGVVRSSRSLPVLGIVAFALGVFVAVLGATQARRANFILGGSMVAELGLVACTPMLVGLAGRLSPFLYGSMRLALRDAARNRSRSAPAVAAILAAAAGCVGVLIYTTSGQAHDRADYLPSAPIGTAVAQLPWGDVDGDNGVDPAAVLTAVRSSLPVDRAAVVDTAGGTCVAGKCTSVNVKLPPACHTKLAACTGGGGALTSPAVGAPGVVSLLAGRSDTAAEQALRAGDAVVFNPALLTGGKVTVEVTHYSVGPVDNTGVSNKSVVQQPVAMSFPAVVAPHGDNAVPDVVLSAQAAKQLGVATQAQAVVVSMTATPSQHAEDLARTAVQRAGGSGMYVERGWHDPSQAFDLALIAFAALVIVGAAGVATGLAIADGRADHATLAAVGASPGVRRRLAAGQSAMLGLLGALAGAVAGVIPAAAMLHSHSVAAARNGTSGYPLVLPWTSLAVLVIGVPLLGAACAWLLTRSRLPLGRRAT